MWTAGCGPQRSCAGRGSATSSTTRSTRRCRACRRSGPCSPTRWPRLRRWLMATAPENHWQPLQIPGEPSAANPDGSTGAMDSVPGHLDTGRMWLRNAMAALAVLAIAAAVVSWDAQYVMVHQVKHTPAIAALEAGIPDAGALIFAALGIALALHGRRALRPRALNVACVAISLAMNAMAAGHGWRDIAIWVMPAALYALASDTLIGVVRAWALARMQATGQALAEEDATPLTIAGTVVLWLLRLALAPASTLGGFRRWVVEEIPVAPGRKAATAPPAALALLPPRSAECVCLK